MLVVSVLDDVDNTVNLVDNMVTVDDDSTVSMVDDDRRRKLKIPSEIVLNSSMTGILMTMAMLQWCSTTQCSPVQPLSLLILI